jgi:hypothetical protein
MKTMKPLQWIVLTLLAVIAGCVPTRFAWSPDGKWMTVIGDDNLQFADADGNLLPATIDHVSQAVWFPDSRRVCVCRDQDLSTWDEVAKYLAPEQIERITAGAARARQMALAQNLTTDEQWKAFSGQFLEAQQRAGYDVRVMKDEGLPALIYTRDHDTDGELQKRLPAERWAQFQAFHATVRFVQVYSLSADGRSVEPGATLFTTLHDVRDVRVAPTGRAVAVTTSSLDEHACDLWLAPGDGSKAAVKAVERTSWYPDWSADGRSMYFARAATPSDGDAVRLGAIGRVDVFASDGSIHPDVKPDSVGMVYSELCRVRCLKDGRVIFVSADLTLPATTQDMPQHAQLFAIAPGDSPVITRLLPQATMEQAGDAPQYFEVSPDGARLAIPSGNGRISVTDLASGAVTDVQPDPVPSGDKDGTLLSVPQWRSAEELTFLAPGAKHASPPRVVLWSKSKDAWKTLSDSWPAGLTEAKATPAAAATPPSPPQ